MGKRKEVRKEFLHEVCSVAMEGGINYWATRVVSEHRRGYDEDWYAVLALDEDILGDPKGLERWTRHRADFVDELSAAQKLHRVTISTIARGFSLLKKPETRINKKLRGTLLAASATNDAGDVDAEGADVIVQLGLFGEIVYG